MSDRPLGKDRLGAGSDRIRKRLLIVGGYAVAASLWILISDSLLDVGPSDAMRLSDGVQTVKGLLFVLVTAGGLYWLMLRAARELGAVEAAQGRYEERFSSIFNNVHDLAMLVLSPDGRIVDCNRASTSILGWSAGELRAADVASLCVDDDGAQGWIDQFIAEAAETAHAGHDFWHR